MPYQREIMFRGKLIPIKKLSPHSDKKITIICPLCKAHIERYAKVLFSSGNFLCQSCTIRENQSRTLEVGRVYNFFTVIGKSSTGRSKVKCKCGKTKVVNNWSIHSGKTKSCGCIVSKKLKQFRIKNPGFQKGDEHPNWRGGLSRERSRVMATQEYKEWRYEVFKRDNYRCVSCGANSNTLEAHHILPFAKYKKLRTDINNGVTLCKKHHTEFHSLYGRVDIGEEEFNEYISRS